MSESVGMTAAEIASEAREANPEKAVPGGALPPPAPGQPSLLGPETHFEGLLAFQGEARIDGTLSGQVRGRGRLLIGEDARVEADICADVVVVDGAVQGALRARESLHLGATASVEGDVTTPVLTMGDGALLSGRCSAGVSPESRDPKGKSRPTSA